MQTSTSLIIRCVFRLRADMLWHQAQPTDVDTCSCVRLPAHQVMARAESLIQEFVTLVYCDGIQNVCIRTDGDDGASRSCEGGTHMKHSGLNDTQLEHPSDRS